MVQDRTSRNQAVIEEFRANHGQISGRHADSTLLLTTTGKKSGRQHTTPVGYMRDGNRLLVFASKGGSPENPDWYVNLVANPVVKVEVGDDAYEARAKVVKGEERDRLYARQVERSPVFGEYEQRTSRRIPVVAIERIS